MFVLVGGSLGQWVLKLRLGGALKTRLVHAGPYVFPMGNQISYVVPYQENSENLNSSLQ